MVDHSKVGRKSKRKGADGEREIARILREHGYEDARRGQQYCGASGDADVVGLPGIHLEIKRVESLRLYDALAQAEADANEDEVPVVVHRRNKRKWVAILDLDDFIKIYGETNPPDQEGGEDDQG